MSVPKYIDLGIGMLGNVDSSKSTTVGQLVTGGKDNGNGKLRRLISRHPHEIESGRTSDTAYHTGIFGNNRITFVDLAGHEKYLKTTISGLGVLIPDLLLLCVDKYSPTYKMTKEHIGLALRMNIPFVILMTKIDLYEKEITDVSIEGLRRIIKKASGRTLQEVSSMENVDDAVSAYKNLMIVPVFRISNVTHQGVDLLRDFLSKITVCSSSYFTHSKKFMIDKSYRVKGIGLVVTGFNGGGTISCGDKMYLNGNVEVHIRSIHNDFKEDVKFLPGNTRGCLAIRTTAEWIRPGSVISSKPLTLTKKFTASVEILSSHSTSITNGYQTVIHCGPIRRTAYVRSLGETTFRGGMKGELEFEFMNPAWVEVGQSIFFREGRIIGDGKITSVV